MTAATVNASPRLGCYICRLLTPSSGTKRENHCHADYDHINDGIHHKGGMEYLPQDGGKLGNQQLRR